MSTPHVFIVDSITFPLHLKYRFAGTTAGETREKHIGLLSDIARVRPGDPVIFYRVGYGFYGIFQIADTHEHPLWEKRDGWLQNQLALPTRARPLIYRVLIEPLEVYRRPVNEWMAIDKLPVRAKDIRWSLFYRKLKGERGCSYLFSHEYEGLKELIISRNPEGPIAGSSEKNELTLENGEISIRAGAPKSMYEGSVNSPLHHINLRGTETHLQTWFTWHIGKNSPVEQIAGNPPWFANECFTGSGMQKIDVLCINTHGSHREFRIIELKVIENKPEDLEQLKRYIWWVKDYVWEEGDIIQPIWVSRGFQKLREARIVASNIASEEHCNLPRLFQWQLVEKEPSFTLL